ncbi:MAG: PorV/PorQ family protein [Ignavibacteriae bacterium]|nr:PorV/PorQ family protein [Ignavibacteriota bacterium]
MVRYTIILLLLLLACRSQQYAQSENKSDPSIGFKTEVDGIGTNAASFLEIGVGTRARALGGAYAAVANDASALFWNPAGIVWAGRVEVEAMHSEWFLDASHEFFGGIVPLPSISSAVGVSFVTLGFGDQPVRTVSRPEGTGETYDARDVAIGLTFASAITDRFSVGLTGKYINSRIWDVSGSAFAIDMGIFYNTQLDGLRLGFSMSNFGTNLAYGGRNLDTTVDPDEEVENFDRVPAQYKTNAYPLPLLFRVGISYQAEFGSFGSPMVTVELNHPSNAPEAINVGMEYGILDVCFLRGGFNGLFDKTAESGLTLGAGVEYFTNSSDLGFRFDYSWSEWGILGSTQSFSLGIVF